MTELEYWTRQIVKGRISRREFLGRAAALGVSMAMATTLLSQAGVAATPKRGGSAKFGLAHGSTTDSGDPAAHPDTATQIPFWGTMSNSLTVVDAKGNVGPDLADSYESADKAATWVFKLRKGATFHNGKDVTAEDVIASFRHHMGAETKSAVKSVLAPIKDIKADDKNTVIFTLQGGNADFPYLASDYHIPIMPAKNGKADWQSDVRTGPFIFESWQPGVSAKFKRNPNYYREGQPYLDAVEFLSITGLAEDAPYIMVGSLDQDEELRRAGLDPAAAVQLEMEPGDLAIWTLFTVHGSAPNTSRDERILMLNSYVRAEDTPQRGEWAFRDGRSIPLGEQPEICRYEQLHEKPGPFYIDEDWTGEQKAAAAAG